jgi:hypothetical protein
MKAAGATDALVETGKQLRKDLLDFVADPIVVVDKVVPVDTAIGQGGLCYAADNRNLRFQVLTWRFDETGGRMHHRHAVFDGNRLSAPCLHVDIAAR